MTSDPAQTSTSLRIPLRSWALEFARRWNAGTFSLFVLHGNIFDLYPVPDGDRTVYGPLKLFLSRRLFPDRKFLLFYDVADGLSFGSKDMQTRFFEWLEVYDRVEGTTWRVSGPPRDFMRLAPILRRFFLRPTTVRGVTLVIDFPEKIVPASDTGASGADERLALVTLLKWASNDDVRRFDVGVILVAESANELHSELLRNPHLAQVRIDLPGVEEREEFLKCEVDLARSDLYHTALTERTAGLTLLRIRQMIAEALQNDARITHSHISSAKQRLIEEYCQGLVRFKDPKPDRSLDDVATHEAAKKRLRELAWLIRNGKTDVLERGVLIPGRVGVGKSFLIDCFASECGLPVMEIGDFRSKWVGDTERQQTRILATIRALGPVIVVVDEADAVFGNRSESGDSGVSSRVFAAFAAHLGDSSLRGRELWVAMTSRPDLMAIDMKRQGRFGLALPLFPAQSAEEVSLLFEVVAKTKRITLPADCMALVETHLGAHALTGSDVESILIRAKERAVIAERDNELQTEDLRHAIESFIDPLDPTLLRLQELAAILACSDKRYLPERLKELDRSALTEEFLRLKTRFR